MSTTLILLVVTVVTALIFDFLNGFHDAANSIATVVSTRVLSPNWPWCGRLRSTFWPVFFWELRLPRPLAAA